MNLTGKCKKDFYSYYEDLNIPHYYINVDFESLEDSMKYGVYVDFFHIVLIDVDKLMMDHYKLMSSYTLKDHCRKLAIEQGNEIYNKLMNKN